MSEPQRPEPATEAGRALLFEGVVELHEWTCAYRTGPFPRPKVCDCDLGRAILSIEAEARAYQAELEDRRAEARAAERTETGSTVEEVTEWLGRAEGRIEDIFGLWVQGKRDERWVAEKLVGEGHLRALAAERTESRYREVIERARRTNVPAATLARRMADEDR